MRIRLPATRSPPCLDAGRRGFATMVDPRESFPYLRMSGGQRRLYGELIPSGELQGREGDGPGSRSGGWSVSGTCRFPDAGVEKGRSGAVALALVCDWALPTAFRPKRGWLIGVRNSRPGPRKGCPPEGTRSAAHAGRHAQRSEHGAAGKAASAAGQPGREAMRPERRRDHDQHQARPRPRSHSHGHCRPCRRRCRERSPCRHQ